MCICCCCCCCCVQRVRGARAVLCCAVLCYTVPVWEFSEARPPGTSKKEESIFLMIIEEEGRGRKKSVLFRNNKRSSFSRNGFLARSHMLPQSQLFTECTQIVYFSHVASTTAPSNPSSLILINRRSSSFREPFCLGPSTLVLYKYIVVISTRHLYHPSSA